MPINEFLPRLGDSLFKVNPTGDVNVDLSFLKSDKFDFLYASGFKRAGDAIIQQYEDTHEWYKEPELFMPAMYSYRHFIELTLKRQIKFAVGWKLVAPTENDMRSHDLLRLWKLAKTVIEALWYTCEPGLLDAVERIIKELHTIDQSGQNMRYASDTKGINALDHVPNMVSLDQIRTTMQKVCEFFEELDKEWQNYKSQHWTWKMQEELIKSGGTKIGSD
jgi:hypothetical protein